MTKDKLTQMTADVRRLEFEVGRFKVAPVRLGSFERAQASALTALLRRAAGQMQELAAEIQFALLETDL